MYDHIVIGGGIIGSCVAKYLQAKNKNVLLIEQFSKEKNQGGSSGMSRIIRKSYEEPYFVQLAKETYDMWREIEEESCQKLIIQTGMLLFAKNSGHSIEACNNNVKNITGDCLKKIDIDIMKEKYHQFLYSDEYIKYYEETGGVILANKALFEMQELFKKSGGTIIDNSKVINIIPGDINTIETVDQKYKTSSVVICAGPWTNKILQFLNLQLPIKTPKVRVYYWKQKEPTKFDTNLPAFIDFDGIGTHIYGLPAFEYPGYVKICAHGGDECNPDEKETTGTTDLYVDKLCCYIKQHFPGLEHHQPGIIETCIYSKTPDNSFILDYHPTYKNIVIGAGFSGTGFKLAPVIGKILGDLASNIPSSYNLEPFLISRFNETVLKR